VSVIVLGLDPGFAKIGWATTRLTANGVEPIAMGLIQTKKSDKKLNVLASDDNFRRGKEIARALYDIATDTKDGKIYTICAERKSFPRNASAAAKVAYCWGVMCLLSEITGIPLIQASPQQIKQKMCGKANASKAEVQEACRQHFGDEISNLVKGIARSNIEHPYDALATVLACSDSETLRLARRMADL
jgi:Holliday junction resolvasome RuvABC endonuclease subunit